MELLDKNIIVFGGAGKLGLPISEGLAKAGARITIASRNATNKNIYQKINDCGNISCLDVNATNEKEMKSLFNSFDRIDGCIFCTTIRPMTKFLSSDIETWRQSVLDNSTSLYLSNLLAAEHFKISGGGAIINISSIYGLQAPDPKIYEGTDMGTEPDYPFIKGGTIMLTKYMATMYGKFGVRVNCLAPGGLEGDQPGNFKKKYIAKVPMGRMMQGKDLVGPAIFLMSDMSRYITGVTLPVDGGLTI